MTWLFRERRFIKISSYDTIFMVGLWVHVFVCIAMVIGKRFIISHSVLAACLMSMALHG